MNNLNPLIWLIVIGLIVIFVWNSFSIWRIKKDATLNEKILNDSKYWELKYKLEFLLALVAIIAATAGFLGYNTKENIEANLKTQIKSKTDSLEIGFKKRVDTLTQKLLTLDSNSAIISAYYIQLSKNASKNQKLLDKLNAKQKSISVSADQYESVYQQLNKKVITLSKSDVLKLPIYIVTNYRIDYPKEFNIEANIKFQT